MFNLYDMPKPFKDINGFISDTKTKSVSFFKSYFFQSRLKKQNKQKKGDLLSKNKKKKQLLMWSNIRSSHCISKVKL